jgi:hypothetical protein
VERKDSKHTIDVDQHADLHPGREFAHALALGQAAVVSSRQKLSATSRADAVRRFVVWALARLEESSALYTGIEHGNDGDRAMWLDLPRALRDEFGGPARVWLRLDALTDIAAAGDNDDGDSNSGADDQPAQTRAVLPWLIEQLTKSHVVSHAKPEAQPASVHELANRLFSAYQLDGGTIHLAGCTLEDRVILGLTYRLQIEKTEPVERDVTVFVTPDGAPVDAETIAALDLTDRAAVTRPPRLHPEEMIRLVEVIRQSGDRIRDEELRREGYSVGDGTDLRRVSCELGSGVFIWCKYAEGKIQFDFGEDSAGVPISASVPFSGWARTVQPQPYDCPHTGVKSFYLAKTDDGRIVAAEQVGTCQASGRRVVRSELVECDATGQSVMADLAEICPVTERPVQPDRMVRCLTCDQRVSPVALAEGTCAACRGRLPVQRDDERLARIVASYPALAHWSDFLLAETLTSYNLTASRRLQKLLVVLEKETLTPLHGATAKRWSKSWQAMSAEELPAMLE